MAQTLDTDHSGEATAILAEATLVVEEEFHHAHHRDAIIGDSAALKDVLRQAEEVCAPNTLIAHCARRSHMGEVGAGSPETDADAPNGDSPL